MESYWKRCQNCDHIDTTVPERICEVCGCPIGRFAKPTVKTCQGCKSNPKLIRGNVCQTPYCGGKIRLQQRSIYCDGCLYELKNWNVNDGPGWKRIAVGIFNEPTQIKACWDRLLISFPEISRYKIEDWIKRQVTLGNLIWLDRGIYQKRNTWND